MKWVVKVDQIATWLKSLDDKTYELVMAAIRLLELEGPRLKRPIVGQLHSQVCKNLKELRPGSAKKSEVRVIFIFDPQRQAIMLVAGDKSKNWKKWYQKNIPLAEKKYLEYLEKQKGKNDSSRI